MLLQVPGRYRNVFILLKRHIRQRYKKITYSCFNLFLGLISSYFGDRFEAHILEYGQERIVRRWGSMLAGIYVVISGNWYNRTRV